MVLVHVHRFHQPTNKTTHTQSTQRNRRGGHLRATFSSKMRRGGACVPARTSAQRRFHTKIYLRITYHARGFNDGCALVGRRGRAHRHRPYQSPSYFSTKPHTNQITIYAQSTQTTSTIHAQSAQTTPTVPRPIHPNETVGADIRTQFSQAKCVEAVPVCPPERPRSGVSIRK